MKVSDALLLQGASARQYVGYFTQLLLLRWTPELQLISQRGFPSFKHIWGFSENIWGQPPTLPLPHYKENMRTLRPVNGRESPHLLLGIKLQSYKLLEIAAGSSAFQQKDQISNKRHEHLAP